MRYFILKTFTDDEAETCKRCNMPELIKCKDCKYGAKTINAKDEPMIDCVLMYDDAWLKDPDWFCADGERK